jgi:hypothetical protein
MISGRLTMRATIERNQASATDDWGGPVAAVFASIGAALPCFVYSNKATTVSDGAKNTETEDLRAMFALGADLAPNDEIASVTDRRGVEIIPGRLRVMGPVQRKHTHVEAALRRIS